MSVTGVTLSQLNQYIDLYVTYVIQQPDSGYSNLSVAELVKRFEEMSKGNQSKPKGAFEAGEIPKRMVQERIDQLEELEELQQNLAQTQAENRQIKNQLAAVNQAQAEAQARQAQAKAQAGEAPAADQKAVNDAFVKGKAEGKAEGIAEAQAAGKAEAQAVAQVEAKPVVPAGAVASPDEIAALQQQLATEQKKNQELVIASSLQDDALPTADELKQLQTEFDISKAEAEMIKRLKLVEHQVTVIKDLLSIILAKRDYSYYFKSGKDMLKTQNTMFQLKGSDGVQDYTVDNFDVELKQVTYKSNDPPLQTYKNINNLFEELKTQKSTKQIKNNNYWHVHNKEFPDDPEIYFLKHTAPTDYTNNGPWSAEKEATLQDFLENVKRSLMASDFQSYDDNTTDRILYFMNLLRKYTGKDAEDGEQAIGGTAPILFRLIQVLKSQGRNSGREFTWDKLLHEDLLKTPAGKHLNEITNQEKFRVSMERRAAVLQYLQQLFCIDNQVIDLFNEIANMIGKLQPIIDKIASWQPLMDKMRNANAFANHYIQLIKEVGQNMIFLITTIIDQVIKGIARHKIVMNFPAESYDGKKAAIDFSLLHLLVCLDSQANQTIFNPDHKLHTVAKKCQGVFMQMNTFDYYAINHYPYLIDCLAPLMYFEKKYYTQDYKIDTQYLRTKYFKKPNNTYLAGQIDEAFTNSFQSGLFQRPEEVSITFGSHKKQVPNDNLYVDVDEFNTFFISVSKDDKYKGTQMFDLKREMLKINDKKQFE